MAYQKQIPLISYQAFLKKVKEVKKFTSSTGRRYHVNGLISNMLYFQRVDAGGTDWDMDLEKLYNAYVHLEDFTLVSFRPFIPRRHAPGRGLLLHLKMITEVSNNLK